MRCGGGDVLGGEQITLLEIVTAQGVDEVVGDFGAVESRVEGQTTVVTVGGEVDAASADTLRNAIGDVIDGGQLSVAVDMHEVSFMDSSGLRVLIGDCNRRIVGLETRAGLAKIDRQDRCRGLNGDLSQKLG